jgi:hypothetical protein
MVFVTALSYPATIQLTNIGMIYIMHADCFIQEAETRTDTNQEEGKNGYQSSYTQEI